MSELNNYVWTLQKVFTAVEIQRFKEVIRKFGPNIKQFLLRARLSTWDICEVLAMMPKLESLVFQVVAPTNNRSVRDREELNLHHLKRLVIDKSDETSIQVFKRVPAGVLSEITLIDLWVWDENEAISGIFKKQLNLTHLYCDSPFPLHLIKNLKLTELSLRYRAFDTRSEIFGMLKTQTGLECLIIDLALNHESMTVINQMKNLKELELRIEEGSSTAVNEIPRVKKLGLRGLNRECIDAFLELDNSHLESLLLDRAFVLEFMTGRITASAPNIQRIIFSRRFFN